MANYVGIDLGVTNSVICTYDGSQTWVWKSPEMGDVTPSVIYIDRRGSRFVGQTAYNAAPAKSRQLCNVIQTFHGNKHTN